LMDKRRLLNAATPKPRIGAAGSEHVRRGGGFVGPGNQTPKNAAIHS
jgi:hypothetical protein